MHRPTRERIVYHCDKAHAPALTVDAEAVVVLETYAARTGTMWPAAALLDHHRPRGVFPRIT